MRRIRAILVVLCAAKAAPAQRRSTLHDVAPIPAPACAAPGTTCFADTTRSTFTECCMSSGVADWLILPRARDSIEFFAQVPDGSSGVPSVTMMQIGRRQGWQEHLPGLTAPFLRHRFSTGAYVLTVDLEGEPRIGLPYTLVVRQVVDDSSPRWSAPAHLRLVGSFKTRWRVRPVDSPSDGDNTSFVVGAGLYKVLAYTGTLTICRLPCTTASQRVSLQPSRLTVVR